jgi:hypothetical protein
MEKIPIAQDIIIISFFIEEMAIGFTEVGFVLF